jgi:hypothetical protein
MIDNAPSDPSQSVEPTPLKCRQCDEPCIDFCRHCGQEFCVNHRSRYNPKMCSGCVSDSSLQVAREPITDEDGTQHQGTRMRLIGEGWPNSLHLIKDMTDLELEDQISDLATGLKEAQLTLDYKKILYSAATFEKDRRVHSNAVKARRRREKIEQGAVKLNGKSVRMKTVADPIDLLAKQLKIPYDQAKAVMAMLGKAK